MQVIIEGKTYQLQYDQQVPFVTPPLKVAYCDELAKTYMPILLDPQGYGSQPFPPEFIAYRLVVDDVKKRLCIIYEVYWKRQECTWKELNKDHDHDYEPIHLHFNLETGEMEKVVISSVGPVQYAGHGVEVYSHTTQITRRPVEGQTFSKESFPWGQHRYETEILEQPISNLVFRDRKPVILVINCYHVFTGLKPWRESSYHKTEELKPTLKRLDQWLLKRWYFHHSRNKFGHDVSNPFKEPYILYYPPPEDLKSRIVYSLLWIFSVIKRRIARLEK